MKFDEALKENTNFTYTTNGALAHNSTMSMVYDCFAFGGAYRGRSNGDCILLFKNAFEESEEYAMKCLFYLRDIRGGVGERRFFRVCLNWLAKEHPMAVLRNMRYIADMGRFDDYYCLVGTPMEDTMFEFLYDIFIQDVRMLEVENGAVSLLAKWLASPNASSKETCRLGRLTAKKFDLTERTYRKALSALRTRINIVEKLMSENRWDEIQYGKLPSQAGMRYNQAFQRHDEERYHEFMSNKTTKVNAGVLFPYECVREALKKYHLDEKDSGRLAVNKYWDNLKNVFDGYTFDGLCVCDTSGSMEGMPICVAISLAMYCAERCNGVFKNHYISFSSTPQMIKVKGTDFVDKVRRIYMTNLCENTNLEAVFDLLLDIADRPDVDENTIPKNIIVISDMQIDSMTGDWRGRGRWTTKTTLTEMEAIRKKWESHGHKMPNLVYWNVNATNNTILDLGPNVTFVSGMSSNIFTQIMTGKTGIDLMYETLNSDRYKNIK